MLAHDGHGLRANCALGDNELSRLCGRHALGALHRGLRFGEPLHGELLLGRVGESMRVGTVLGVVEPA
jgi:hypothetical protein